MKQIRIVPPIALVAALIVLSSVYAPERTVLAQNGTLPPTTAPQTAAPTAWCNVYPCKLEPTSTHTPTPPEPPTLVTFTPPPPPPPPSTFTPTTTPAPPTTPPSAFTPTPLRAKEHDTANSHPVTATPAPDLATALLQLARAQRILIVSPAHPLTDRLLAAGSAPTSPVFASEAAGIYYTAQRGEDLLSDRVRIFYWLESDRSRVRFIEAPADPGDPFAKGLVQAGATQQVLQLNPNATLQRAMAAEDFLPISGEFTLHYAGVSYIAQIAQARRNASRRIFFVVLGRWEQVKTMAFN